MSALTAGRFRFAPVLAGTVLTVLLLLLFARTADIFLLLFIAVLISLFLGALADAIALRVRGISRRFALLIAVLITIAAVVGFFWLLVPPIVDQTQNLIKVLPDYLLRWETGIDRAMARIPALRGFAQPGEHRVLLAVYDQLSGYVSGLFPKVVGLFRTTIEVLSIAIMGIYLALHPGLYREFLISLFPPLHRDLVRSVLGDLAAQLRAWIVGQLIAMLLLGALTAIGLSLIGVPYWLTFGIFTGAVSIIPFFGSLASTLLPALFVLGGAGGVTKALLVVALGVVIHLIEGNVVGPLIMQHQVRLPPVMTIMAVLIMGKLLGFVGLLVAVPTLTVVDVIIRRILINRVYEGQGFRRLIRDSAFVVRVPVVDGEVIISDLSPPDILARAEEEQRRRAA